MTNGQIARKFVDAINNHHVQAIVDLMTDDHRFVDSLGASVDGRKSLREAWLGYFQMAPDYTIIIDELFEQDEVVVLIGRTWGTYTAGGKLTPGNRWDTPSAWRAVVKEGHVSQWQVFADNEPIRKLMRAEEQSLDAS